MKKLKVALLTFFLLIISMAIKNNVYAVSINYVDSNSLLNSNYGYTMRLNDISHDRIEVSGNFSFYSSKYLTPGTTLYNYWTAEWPTAGSTWIRYKNVGYVNGQSIDLKVTLVSYSNAEAIRDGKVQPQLAFNDSSYMFYVIGLNDTCFRYEFLVSGTDTRADMKGYLALQDLDWAQYVTAVSGVDSMYINSNTQLYIDGDTIRSRADYDNPESNVSNHECLAMVFINNGAEIKLSTTRYKSDLCIFSLGMVSLAPFNQPDPSKSVSTTLAHTGETVTYNVSQFVPMEDTSYLYNNFTFSDTVPNGLSVQSGNVRVYDQGGVDVTGYFNISVNGNSVTASMKGEYLSNQAYYCNTYRLSIPCTVNSNLAGSTSSNGTYLNNSSNVTTSRGTKTTNTVTTEVKYHITTSIDHGSITGSIYEIKGGSSQTISYTPKSGYYISRIVVDGQDQSISNINGGSYTFNNISQDHDIQVYTTPKRIKINLSKEDKETGKTKDGDAVLSGAKYGIYRDDANCSSSSLIETLTTDANGNATSKEYNVVDGDTYHKYYLKEISPSTGYLIDSTVYTVSPDYTGQNTQSQGFSFTSKEQVIKNSISITKYLDKTDSTLKKKLNGVVFKATLNSNASKVYYSTTTDTNGYCTISDLPYGTYTVVESTIPDTAFDGRFYVGATNVYSKAFTVSITEDKTVRGAYTYSDINDVPKKMRIIIYKEDIETGTTTQGDAHLENAEYTIYRDSNCTDSVETLTIQKNSDGTYSATSGWYLVGTYYVKETKAPEGYLIDKNVYEVKQVPSEQTSEYTTHTITSKDEVKRNDIDITKYLDKTDSTSKQNLAGAEFTAQIVNQSSPDKDKTYKATTDANGHCVIEDLPYGTYRVWESKVPDTAYNGEFYVNGATTRSTSFNQFIELDDTERGAYTYSDINDVPKKMQITIYKEDIETGTHVQGDGHLEGAEYTTYRDSNCTDPVETLTIAKNEDGTYSATSGWYLVGTYYVKETKAPEGYLIDENVYEVKQVPAEQTDEYSSHSITSKDKVMKGLVHGIKYNNNSQSTDKSPAEGAKLRLTLDSNPSVYYDVVVNKDGYYDFIDIVDDTHYSSTENHYVEGDYPYTIPYGVYTISEVEASNSGENIFIDDQKTEIRYNRQEQYYILNDEYARIRPTIEIRDSETKKLIPGGATYKIWNVSKQEWYSEREYPSGKYITEFTTNDEGKLTVNGFLESGSYVIYETKAPYGYYLNDEMREGQKGYEFTLGVEKDGNVVAYHDGEKQVLEYTTQNYNNIPTKIYSYTADTYNDPQKAVIDIEKLASQFTKVEKAGEKNNLVFEEVGLKDVRFKLVATEDIITPEGTKRYSQGDVVSDNITDIEGLAKTNEVYLGKYRLEEVSTPNGYLSENSQIELNIEYTNQYERLQNIDEEIKNKKQEVKLEFEKVYKELEVSKFKFSNRSATFGIYTASALKNYKGETVIGKDELVDVMTTDENSKLRNNVELPEGEYYVKEISVTSPYARKEDEYGFKVEYTNNTDEEVNVTVNDGKVENEASTAELELLVYPDFIWDEEGIDKITDRQELEELAKKYGIANKKYGVYLDEECTKQVEQIDGNKAEFETDENGIINIKDMPTGTYYFKETVSPYGYDMSDEVIKAEIKEGQKVVILKAKEPSKKAVLLRKYDTFTKDVISDVEFKITDEDEKEVYTSKTNEKGELEVPIILFEDGKKYYFEETSESKLYKVNKEKVEFTASIDEEKCEWTLDTIEVGNDRKTIDEVKIVKKDSKTDEPLQGCVFTIALLDENGNEYVNAQGETIYLVKEAVTGEDGTYSIENVPYGRYRFIEIKAPEGYEMDEDITGLEFSVDENSGDKIVFEVTNTGDIAVIALSVVAVVSVIGIVYVIVKNKKKNK